MKRRSVLGILAGLAVSGLARPTMQQMLVASGKPFLATWTTVATMGASTIQWIGGCGSASAALKVAGQDIATGTRSTDCEKYNGAAWSAFGSLATTRIQAPAVGGPTAALCIGGINASNTELTACESHSGSTWSSAGSLAASRRLGPACGSPTAALAIGGFSSGSNVNLVTLYNGTAWSSAGTQLTTRREHGACGTSTDALSFGGFTTVTVATTESFNGSTSSSGGNLATARYDPLAFGGSNGSLASTETYSAGAWASGGNMNVGRGTHGGAGSNTSALAFGGVGTSSERYA